MVEQQVRQARRWTIGALNLESLSLSGPVASRAAGSRLSVLCSGWAACGAAEKCVFVGVQRNPPLASTSASPYCLPAPTGRYDFCNLALQLAG